MRLWQGRLLGFQMETKITPATPAPSWDLWAALREAKPPCQGLLSWLLPKQDKMGIFLPILGTGELPTQQGQVWSFSLEHP